MHLADLYSSKEPSSDLAPLAEPEPETLPHNMSACSCTFAVVGCVAPRSDSYMFLKMKKKRFGGAGAGTS